jgi:hypothetical protein
MDPTAAHAAKSIVEPTGVEVSLVRLYVLRATYLLLVVGLGQMILPELLGHEPMAHGIVPSLLGGVWLLAFAGLRYPLRMLPLLMFELAWKAIWLFAYGLPQWATKQMPETFADDFTAIAAGVILMPIVIPWGYVYRHYIRARGDRWRRGHQAR